MLGLLERAVALPLGDESLKVGVVQRIGQRGMLVQLVSRVGRDELLATTHHSVEGSRHLVPTPAGQSEPNDRLLQSRNALHHLAVIATRLWMNHRNGFKRGMTIRGAVKHDLDARRAGSYQIDRVA